MNRWDDSDLGYKVRVHGIPAVPTMTRITMDTTFGEQVTVARGDFVAVTYRTGMDYDPCRVWVGGRGVGSLCQVVEGTVVNGIDSVSLMRMPGVFDHPDARDGCDPGYAAVQAVDLPLDRVRVARHWPGYDPSGSSLGLPWRSWGHAESHWQGNGKSGMCFVGETQQSAHIWLTAVGLHRNRFHVIRRGSDLSGRDRDSLVAFTIADQRDRRCQVEEDDWSREDFQAAMARGWVIVPIPDGQLIRDSMR